MAIAPTRKALEHDLQEPEFLVGASSDSPRAHETLKHNDAFAVLDTHGDIGVFGSGADGLFYKDTRYLSHLELLMARSAPLLLGSTLDSGSLQLCSDLTNPDVFAEGRLWLHKDAVHIYRTSYVRDGAIRQRLMFTNHSSSDLELAVSLVFDCDFADIFEARGLRRNKRGSLARTLQSSQSVLFRYHGLDDVERRTTVHVEPAPVSMRETAALYYLHLPPKSSSRIFFTATAEAHIAKPACSYVRGLRDARRSMRRSEEHATTIDVSGTDVALVLKRSISDLRVLTTQTDDGPYPYAGTPWYSTTFGRDALITAWQMLWFDASIARGVLRRLARFQAQDFDADADAQPGKILHEMRDGEMAALREIPFGRYYGSVDSTPLFIVVAGAYFEATGDREFLNEIWPSIQRALAWIDGPGDPDNDGFVEYARQTANGLSNQGWKDSHDAIFHEDGRLAQGPIALVEVQGYVYAARLAAARMAAELGRDDQSALLVKQAVALQRIFEESFWCEDLGIYALALDGEKKPARARSSNAGHVLATGIASPEHAARVVDQMLNRNFFSGWGIRTIAMSEARYNPMSYHNGSIWPHDNSMIAMGMSRYGFRAKIEQVFDGMLDAALTMDQHRLPELFCGFRRRSGRSPILYPVACSPQAWASGAMLQMLSAMLGLSIDAASATITLRDPCVPMRAGAIKIRNMRVGEGAADFVIESRGGSARVDVASIRGGARVVLAA